MSDIVPPHPTIRPYRPDDLDPVVDLWYETWHATFPDPRHHEPKEAWRRRFEAEIAAEEQVYVAEVEGRLAGFLVVKDRGERWGEDGGLLGDRQRVRAVAWGCGVHGTVARGNRRRAKHPGGPPWQQRGGHRGRVRLFDG